MAQYRNAQAYYSDGSSARVPASVSRADALPRRPRLKSIPGSSAPAQAPLLSASILFAAKIVAVVLVLATVLAFISLSLNAATVSTNIKTQSLQAELSEARSTGNTLEVNYSSLSNGIRLRQEALALGMTVPDEVEDIVIPADVVVTTSDGSLSLAQSVAVAVSLES